MSAAPSTTDYSTKAALARIAALVVICLSPLVASAQWISRPGPWTPASAAIVGLAIVPSASDRSATLFTAVQWRGQGLYRSSDEGLTWQPVPIPGYENDFILWLGTDAGGAATPVNLYVSIAVDGGFTELIRCDILRSADGGATWITLARNTSACLLSFDPSSPQRLYAVGSGYPATYIATVYRSEDAGRTWTSIGSQYTNLKASSVRTIRVSNDGETVYADNWVSRDHGKSWTPTVTPIPIRDIVAFNHPQYGSRYALAATADGLYQTIDNGTSWQPAGLQGFVVESLGSPSVANGRWQVAVGYRGGAALIGSDGLASYRSGLADGEGLWALIDRYAINGRMLSVCPDPSTCKGGALPHLVTLIEYHNSVLNHYFMTIDGAETMAIDRGAAGPGWTRTGQTFDTFADIQATTLREAPVCRFYGTPGVGPNSHFFTADSTECTTVKADRGWTFEAPAVFTIKTPNTRHLPPGTSTTLIEKFCDGGVPIYRLYNNRFASNDSNHRYVSDPVLYEAMKSQGWLPEGVMMCAVR